MSPAPSTTEDAQLGGRLLGALTQVPASHGVVAIMRHSARDDITDVREAPFVPLNAHGLEAARRFGASLPQGRSLVLEHSPIERCQQTAEQILEGYGAGELLGPDEGLGIPYIRDLERLVALASHMGQREFAARWFSDELEPGVVQAAAEAARDLAAIATARLSAAAPGELRLLVSHDWNVLLIRERLMGLKHQELGWLDFLDGVAFTADEGAIGLQWGEEHALLSEDDKTRSR